MRVIKVPCHPNEPLEIISVDYGWENFAAAIGGPCTYIERFRCPLTPVHNLVGVLDEDGQYNGQPTNQRAWELYPLAGYELKGTVLVVQEGMTPDGPDFIDMEDPEECLRLVHALLEGATR